MQKGKQHGSSEYNDLQNWLDVTSHDNPLYVMCGRVPLCFRKCVMGECQLPPPRFFRFGGRGKITTIQDFWHSLKTKVGWGGLGWKNIT